MQDLIQGMRGDHPQEAITGLVLDFGEVLKPGRRSEIVMELGFVDVSEISRRDDLLESSHVAIVPPV
jgi:hypothetical protein